MTQPRFEDTVRVSYNHGKVFLHLGVPDQASLEIFTDIEAAVRRLLELDLPIMYREPNNDRGQLTDLFMVKVGLYRDQEDRRRELLARYSPQKPSYKQENV